MAGYEDNLNLYNNYANQDMTLKAITGSVSFAGTNTGDGLGGAGFDAAEAKTKSWWIEPGRWDEYESFSWWIPDAFKWDFENIWESDGNGLPTLRDMPPGVQNPVLKQ